MSARYEISEGELDVLAITGPEGTRYIDGEEIEARVIRQQSADIAALKDALAEEVTANEAFRKAGGARDDEDMPAFCARLIAEAEIGRKWNANSALEEWFPLTADCIKRDALELADTRLLLRSVQTQLANADTVLAELFPAAEALREELAAVAGERDRIKGDYGEAAHFGRHFIRDDPAITPRGAIIRLGDKCTDLFVRLQQAEARLSAIDSAPVVAVIDRGEEGPIFADLKLEYECSEKPISIGTELIAKPAKD